MIAPLVGLVAQQACEAAASEWLVRLRRRFFIGMGLVAAGLGAWVVDATALQLGPGRGQQPVAFAIVFAVAALAAMATSLWASARPEPWRQRLGTLTVGALLGLGYIGAIINIFVATRHPIGDEIAAVAGLPRDVQLVSIGRVDDVFLYYYGKPIIQLPETAGIDRKEPAWTYFCMGCGPKIPAFDMPYEKLGVISMEQAYSENPHDVVIIGRRLPNATARKENNSVR